MRTVVLITLATLALTACDAQDPVADGANDAAGQTDVVLPPDETAPIPANEVESEAGDPSASSAPSGTIPASLQGRWGLTPGDCTSTPGVAKGLLLVSGDMLRFYESVARPAGTLETSANSASGEFVLPP